MPSAILELEAAMQNSSPEMLEGRANNNNNHHLMMSELLLRSTDSTSPAQSFSSAMGMDPSQMTLLSQHDPAAIAEMMAFRSMSPASMNMKQGFETADFEQMFAMSGLSLDHPHPHHHHHHHLNHHQQHLHGGLPDRPQSTPVGLGGRPGKLSRTAAARQQRASSSSFGKHIITFSKEQAYCDTFYLHPSLLFFSFQAYPIVP